MHDFHHTPIEILLCLFPWIKYDTVHIILALNKTLYERLVNSYVFWKFIFSATYGEDSDPVTLQIESKETLIKVSPWKVCWHFWRNTITKHTYFDLFRDIPPHYIRIGLSMIYLIKARKCEMVLIPNFYKGYQEYLFPPSYAYIKYVTERAYLVLCKICGLDVFRKCKLCLEGVLDKIDNKMACISRSNRHRHCSMYKHITGINHN